VPGLPARGSGLRVRSGVRSGVGSLQADALRYRFEQATWKPVSTVAACITVTATGLGEVTAQLEATSRKDTL